MPVSQIVFIHGMYMTGSSCAPCVYRAASRGYESQAPRGRSTTAHRRNFARAATPHWALTFGAVTDHMKALIDTMRERRS